MATHRLYIFAHVGTTKNYQTFVCTRCKKNRWISIKVIDDELFTDPCNLPHVCTPVELGRDIANRIVYEELHRMREDPERYSGKTPYAVWDSILWATDSEDEELKNIVLAEIHGVDDESRRQSISRRINEVRGDPVTLTSIPPSLSKFSDGTHFLQEGPDEELHIYYSEKTLEKACRYGLFALVGDGVHSYQPPQMAQLYTIHAMCEGGIELPILHAITARKTAGVYERTFSHLRTHLQRHGIPESRLRIILDFEKASRAAHKVFPRAKVEGCSFHLGQVWTRCRNALGATFYMQGVGKDPAIADW